MITAQFAGFSTGHFPVRWLRRNFRNEVVTVPRNRFILGRCLSPDYRVLQPLKHSHMTNSAISPLISH